MSEIGYLDRLTDDWFPLDVMRAEARKPDWVALMVDVHPDDLKTCRCEGPALLYVHPKDYRPGDRTAHSRWFRVSDKYRSKDDAWDALERMIRAARH
jgi:hypothetical protein